ncbi:C2H2-type domain-containing protein [Mycena indigotica]|uniref:C2H2-type domain-containing protein n=1 Tax=Mycena indigotica TaxID=2126181 RepID=A0A8H6SLX6_9AGAR|nr:C2H2-type domain-containing protein [Mycena indigotica]KAF7302180.1 C2H2-type domain-containing protein [Mycena indigotica]
MAALANSRQGRTHRKRVSALRLSSDTTNTLPEYWRDLVPPPEYEPDDVEADAENDTDSEPAPSHYIPPAPPISPRRRLQHRRRPSSPQDAFIDSLLERSVHALELSNALLQSSITPTTSTLRESSPTASAAAAPIPMPPSRNEAWADDLAKIAHDVDELLVSSSLPPASSPIAHRRPRRRPSLDTDTSSRRTSYLSASTSTSDNGLQMALPSRARFIAPAPRALTQYIDADTTISDDSIALPSTLGLRAAPSDWRITGLPSESKPVVSTSTRSPEPSTPAYQMLSSFVHPPHSTSPKLAVSRSSSRGRAVTRGSRSSSRAGSHTPHRTEVPEVESSTSPLLSTPGTVSSWFSSVHNGPKPDSMPASPPTSSSFTTHSNLSASIIAQLPPENLGHSPQSSDDGGDMGADGCRAKEARSALRRILEEAPPPPRPPAKKFQPRSPPPVPHAASSTATASVSRLFSKGGRHSVSTPPERVVSIMKRSSAPSTPIVAENDKGEGTSKGLGSVFWMGHASKPSSGTSTPRSAKRISFAELPESYTGSKPGGSSISKSKSRKTRNKSKTRAGRKGKGRADDEGSEEGEKEEGWLSWLVGGSALGLGLGLGPGYVDDRERTIGGTGVSARAMWGGASGGLSRSASDEWAV